MNTVGHQLTDVTAQLDAAVRERTAKEDRIKGFETALAGRTVPPDAAKEFEAELALDRAVLVPVRERE